MPSGRKLRQFTIPSSTIRTTDDNCNPWFFNHSLVFCPQMEMNNQLEMLTAREQLMEDIDCIVSAQYGQGNEELADEMIKLLCDAVCKNFPAN